MDELGLHQESPEILAQVIVINAFNFTKEQMVAFYNNGRTFRFAYDEKKFGLTVWPYINEHETPDHSDVDPVAKRLGNVGYYNNQMGLHGHIPGIDKTIKEAVGIVLDKYFK